MLTESEIRTFVDGATQYFAVAARQPAAIGSPYLVTTGSPSVHEYAGMIDISGKRQGRVLFTAPRSMLMVLLMRMNETDTSEENMRDLIGEVANTISGNARRDFGKDFVISVPSVVAAEQGAKASLPDNIRSFVIPINWRSHSAKLIVCIE
jgi:chemotaxis protein CheX